MNEFKEALFRIFTWLLIVIVGGCLFAALCMIGLRSVFGAAETLLPENKPFTLAWEHFTEETNVTFKLWSGTNLIKTFGTNAYRITGTDGTNLTYHATLTNGLPKGTNALQLTVEGPVAGESDPSSNLFVRVLGKPSAPQAPRKL